MCPAPTRQPLLTRSWRSSATTPPNHGAIQDSGIPPSLPPQDTTRSSSSSGPVKKSRKMQGNGMWNLCAREWLTRNKAGSAAEFKVYYDGLSAAERKSYDELAAEKR
ncbi:hypothetical protein AZE42_06902 [Rhizopogon vesiculosus]|uniref:Uncharacterized protein n=1 Tax=Rhizopogon vesiculosus TaxID=180088 RepID=A0A1J8PVU4_9AGAM|nr:hypothetical protein AZE42_06902 [Rhizopogon vesiculosus]